MFNKHYLISKISANVITMGLINMNIMDNVYGNFTQRTKNLRDKLLLDIDELEKMEDSIQNSPGSASYGLYGLSSGSS